MKCPIFDHGLVSYHCENDPKNKISKFFCERTFGISGKIRKISPIKWGKWPKLSNVMLLSENTLTWPLFGQKMAVFWPKSGHLKWPKWPPNGHFGHSGQSEVSENGPNEFLMPKNLGIDTKIKSLACIEPKLDN